jgi:hypothetical protein
MACADVATAKAKTPATNLIMAFLLCETFNKKRFCSVKRNGKPYKELVKIAHPPIIRPSESFVMPGVSCKTMFNNELWTSKPPISRWSAGRRWCEWCYRYRHRRYDYERYE